MGINVIGLNYKSAPIEIREQLAFSREELKLTLVNWSDFFADSEVVLLSTCNRTEIYISVDSENSPESDSVIRYLLKQKSVFRSDLSQSDFSNDLQDISMFLPHIFEYSGESAVEHLFSVTSSLDSMLLGEVQIASQVKSAYQAASDAGTAGTVFNKLFQAALKTAKQIANETELHKNRVSLPSIAVVDFALQVFERLDDKRVLLLGAGEMGRETLQYLCAYGAKNITILNRSIDNAERLAAEFGGHAGNWQYMFELMIDADLIVAATGSPDYIVTLPDFRQVESRRGNRVLFVLDLAVPRDFDPAIGKLGNVYLYSIDDLKETCAINQADRDKEIPKANKIIKNNVNDFIKWLNYRPHSTVIRKLCEQLESLKDTEIARLFNKLSDLSEKEKSEIIYSFERLIGKVLHLPLSSLKDESQNGDSNKLLTALARLFRINNE
ncbi:MAG: glutamyl-tRNA reductase [Planctomycetaceae bacterium]|jgi:glutamyl-tRNA reductase|nr:glutamyl-tRNA reductase [Planctomycetaceae bacterium]